jgi:hypothetical protein
MTSSTSSSGRSRAAALLGLLALLAPGLAAAQAGGVLSGTVTDAATGKPVVGALVIVTNPLLKTEHTEVTDGEGKFQVLDLAPGMYRMSAQLINYQVAERSDLVVKAGTTLKADLAMVPEAVQMEEQVIQVEKLPPRDPNAPPPSKVVVLPPENLAATAVPLRELGLRIEMMTAAAGADVISGARLEEFLAKYRIRYTGGIDRTGSKAARDEVGAQAVLVTTVELFGTSPPRLGLAMRLVTTEEEPTVVWSDAYARDGNDAPGLFNLGIVGDVQELVAEGLSRLGRSLEQYLEGKKFRGRECPGGGWFRPRLAYRARPDQRDVAEVAVLPFVNFTRRYGAGEVVALEFTRQFALADGFRVVEPGIVRDALLRRRIVMEDGVSIDQARTLVATLDVDLVVAGYVFDYEDTPNNIAANFTVMVVDGKTGRVVWESTSFNKGTDSGTLFGLNTVSTVPRLACRMAREVLDSLRGITPKAGL